MKIENRYKEIMSFAAIEATEALSKLLRKSMTTEHIDTSIINTTVKKELVRLYPQKSDNITMTTSLVGIIDGISVIVLPTSSALRLCDALLNRTVGTTTQFNEMEQSALLEVGNIAVGCFLNSLGYVSILNDIVHKKLSLAINTEQARTDLSQMVPIKEEYAIRTSFHIKHADIETLFVFLFNKKILSFLSCESHTSGEQGNFINM